MKMKHFAIGIALLTMTASAMAFDGDRRPTTHGAIVWSTRNRDGNRFSLVFQFGDRGTALGVRYDQNSGYRYGDDRYGRYGQSNCPPDYDYRRFRGHDYDARYFDSYDMWSDWKNWQKRWSKRKNWQCDDRERARAWDAFTSERARAYDQWSRWHDRDDRRGDGDHDRDDRNGRNGYDARYGRHGH